MSAARRKSSDPLVNITKVDVEEFSFQWNIDLGSRFLLASSGRKIKSPLFTGGKKHKYSWQLELSVVPCEESNLSFTLVSVSKADTLKDDDVKATVFASYKSALDAVAKVVNSFTIAKPGNKVGTGISFQSIYTNSKDYLQNNVLTFYCVILMDFGTEQSHASNPTNVVSGSESVFRSLQIAIISGDFSNVTIVTKTKNIPAHKFILAAQSPVFAAMFRSNMEEAKNNSMEIKDFDEKIVDAMIEYMYTGETKLSTHQEHSVDLLRISDKYGLLDLKSSVAKFLELNVKMENAVQLIILASLHNCEALKKSAMDFISWNKDELSRTEEFSKLGSGSYPQILTELYLSMNKRKMAETDAFQNLAIRNPKIFMDLYLAN